MMGIEAQQAAAQTWRLRRGVSPLWTRVLLACGAGSSLLWVATDIVAAIRYEGYSYVDQTFSELSAVDAPTRGLVIPLILVYCLLVIAFGLGVWVCAGRKRALRIVAALLITNGAINLVLTPFSSMHQREVLAAGGGTLTDTLHLVVTTSNVITFLLAIAVGAVALGRGFRLYSILTIVALLVFGGFTGTAAPDVAADEPTPWIGVTERVSAYGWMAWVAVLAILLQKRAAASPDDEGIQGGQPQIARPSAGLVSP